jgi:hypothetical protein
MAMVGGVGDLREHVVGEVDAELWPAVALASSLKGIIAFCCARSVVAVPAMPVKTKPLASASTCSTFIFHQSGLLASSIAVDMPEES